MQFSSYSLFKPSIFVRNRSFWIKGPKKITQSLPPPIQHPIQDHTNSIAKLEVPVLSHTRNLTMAEEKSLHNAMSQIKPMSEDTIKALSTMQAYHPNIYAKVCIKDAIFTVVRGDQIEMPRIAGVNVGDLIRIEQVTELGTINHLLKGSPFVSPNFHHITGIVLEHGHGLKVRCKIGHTRKAKIRRKTKKPRITILAIRDIRIVLPKTAK